MGLEFFHHSGLPIWYHDSRRFVVRPAPYKILNLEILERVDLVSAGLIIPNRALPLESEATQFEAIHPRGR